MLGDINYSLKIIQPQIFLCLPNKTAIAKLKEAYNINQSTKMGKLHEINFTLPYMVERRNKVIRNPYIDKVKERYLLKVKLGSKEEYYIIDKIRKEGNATETKTVHAFLLGYELRDKSFRTYKTEESINALGALTDALSESIWSVGDVDTKFLATYRSFDFSSITALDFVYKIAETFQGLLEWDTLNRKINLLDPETVGQNKGLKIKYGKYLKSIGEEVDTDSIVTKLHIYGKENLSIHRVNPTGQSFLLDFTAFLYPFYREIYDPNNPDHIGKSQHTNPNNGTVYVTLQSSDYMTDNELCHAILDYNDLIKSRTGEFEGYVSEKETLQETLTIKNNEMDTLKTEMAIIEDELVVAKSTGGDTTTLNQQKTDKQAEIDAKQSEIDQVESDIATVDANISSLRTDLAVENNFTVEQLETQNQFTIESTWSDENYFDDKTLYTDSFDVFEKFNTPQIIIDTDIVNFLEVIEEQHNWDKLVLGDIITIEHEMLGIEVEAKIIEIDYDYENSSIRLVIANVKEIITREEQFYRDMYNFTSTSTTVDINKYKFDIVEQTSSEFEAYKNSAIDATKQMIIAGTNESVEISRSGLLLKTPDDPSRFIIQNHGVIALTKDYGNTWNTAISADGIHAPYIIGDMLIGAELKILSKTGKFTFDENGAVLTDASITLNKTGGKSKVLIDPGNGFKIQKLEGSSWNNKFYVDTNGDINLTGNITMNGGSINWSSVSGSVPDSKISSASTWNNKTTKITSSGVYTGTINANQVNTTSLSAITANLGTVTAGSLTGVTITSDNGTGDKVIIGDGSIYSYENNNKYISIRNYRIDFFDDLGAEVGGAYSGWFNGDANRGLVVRGRDYISFGYGTGDQDTTTNIYMDFTTGNLSLLGNTNYSKMGSTGQVYIYAIERSSDPTYRDRAGLEVIESPTTSGVYCFVGDVDQSPGLRASFEVWVHQGGSSANHTQEFKVDTSGAYATAYNNLSTADSKMNIQNYEENAIAKISNTFPKTFNYKEDKKKQHKKKRLGLIAEESPIEILNEKGNAVDLYAMQTLMWKAIQELTKEIEDLKKFE